ncbi:hypothetical protein D3C78_1530670 [compost metagenome]
MAANGLGEIAVEVGHGFQVAFGMPCRQAHAPGRRRAQPRLPDTTAQDPQGLVKGPMDQARRFFLAPLQGALVAVDANLQRVFFAGADLACDQRAAGTARHLEQHRGVVIQLPARDVRTQGGA